MFDKTDYLDADEDGTTIGKDPRKLSQEQLKALPHETSVIAAVRAKCMDCCNDNASEVRKCISVTCPLWPMRMGKNVFSSKRDISDEQRAAASERMKSVRAKRVAKESNE